jgi:hypothetical protein
VPPEWDAVLISLLGGGKAWEVARAAAPALLAEADEMSGGPEKGVQVGVAMGKSGNATDLEALAAGALKAVKFQTTHAATELLETDDELLNE